jgi:hypothetical protein
MYFLSESGVQSDNERMAVFSGYTGMRRYEVNLEALADLFEYYLEAPGMVGGGIDKAESAAARIRRLNEVQGH